MIDRALLARLCEGPASGAALARALGVTRSAVWKRIEALREAGVDVLARPGQGYALARPLQLLDAQALQAALPADARAELAALSLAFETGSTNADALAAPLPAHGCAAFLAERQHAGRGRRGRAWASPLAAHVYLSLARRFDRGLAGLQGLSLAVGVAACEALQALGYPQVGLKWPNDLVAEGRKLGGILVEVGGEAAGPMRVVVGIGLNVQRPARAARGIGQPWIDLASLSSRAPDRAAVALALLSALPLALARFESGGLAPFLQRWPHHDHLAGRAVRLEEGGRVHEGIAAGVAGDGALRLRLADGERCFHAGEASLRAA